MIVFKGMYQRAREFLNEAKMAAEVGFYDFKKKKSMVYLCR